MSMGGGHGGAAGLHGHGWTIEDNLEELEPTGIACNRTVPAAAEGKEASAHPIWDGCPRRRWLL